MSSERKEATLYDLLEELQDCKKYELEASTKVLHTYVIKRIKRFQPDIPLENFTKFTGQKLMNRLYEHGYAKSSIRQVRTYLLQAFDLAIEDHKVTFNPISRCYVPKDAPEQKIEAFSREEQKRLESACQKILHGDAFVFFMYTGLRLMELCNLKWEDYDEASNLLFVRKSKTQTGVRAIYLAEKARAVLFNRPHINEYIFNSKIGKPFTKEVLKKLCQRLSRKTGIEIVRSHMCRHTFATRLIEEGTNPKATAALIGHKDVRFTYAVYVSVEKQRLIKDVCRLNDLRL